VRGDENLAVRAAGLDVKAASEEDWYEEYLRLCMGFRVGGECGRCDRTNINHYL